MLLISNKAVDCEAHRYGRLPQHQCLQGRDDKDGAQTPLPQSQTTPSLARRCCSKYSLELRVASELACLREADNWTDQKFGSPDDKLKIAKR